MTVLSLAVLRQQAVQESLQKRRLADAALAGNQAQLSALNQVFQPPQSSVHTLVLPQGSHRGVF
jgi:hypothetical protein